MQFQKPTVRYGAVHHGTMKARSSHRQAELVMKRVTNGYGSLSRLRSLPLALPRLGGRGWTPRTSAPTPTATTAPPAATPVPPTPLPTTLRKHPHPCLSHAGADPRPRVCPQQHPASRSPRPPHPPSWWSGSRTRQSDGRLFRGVRDLRGTTAFESPRRRGRS